MAAKPLGKIRRPLSGKENCGERKLDVGRCGGCGKLLYEAKAHAERAIRQGHPGDHLNAYRCPTTAGRGYWHVGHLSHEVRAGTAAGPRARRQQPDGVEWVTCEACWMHDCEVAELLRNEELPALTDAERKLIDELEANDARRYRPSG